MTTRVVCSELDLVPYPRSGETPRKDHQQVIRTRSGRPGTLPTIVMDLVNAPRSELIRARNLWIADSPPDLTEWIAHHWVVPSVGSHRTLADRDGSRHRTTVDRRESLIGVLRIRSPVDGSCLSTAAATALGARIPHQPAIRLPADQMCRSHPVQNDGLVTGEWSKRPKI